MTLNRQRKQTVLKTVRDKGRWTGFIAPSKVNEFHVNSGWNIGCKITILKDNYKYFVMKDDGSTSCELDQFLASFKWFNCNNELGYGITYWEDEVNNNANN